MKTFLDYLAESKKLYQFKVAVAGDIETSSVVEQLRSALEKYGIENFTTGKKTPIQESPLEFPQLSNTEVTYFEVDLRYPTTPNVLEEYLAQSCAVDHSHIRVRNLADPLNVAIENAKPTGKYVPLLNTTELGGESGQALVGQNRVMDLLKELETAKKELARESTADQKKK